RGIPKRAPRVASAPANCAPRCGLRKGVAHFIAYALSEPELVPPNASARVPISRGTGGAWLATILHSHIDEGHTFRNSVCNLAGQLRLVRVNGCSGLRRRSFKSSSGRSPQQEGIRNSLGELEIRSGGQAAPPGTPKPDPSQ